jgi:hypothetical protein
MKNLIPSILCEKNYYNEIIIQRGSLSILMTPRLEIHLRGTEKDLMGGVDFLKNMVFE